MSYAEIYDAWKADRRHLDGSGRDDWTGFRRPSKASATTMHRFTMFADGMSMAATTPWIARRGWPMATASASQIPMNSPSQILSTRFTYANCKPRVRTSLAGALRAQTA